MSAPLSRRVARGGSKAARKLRHDFYAQKNQPLAPEAATITEPIDERARRAETLGREIYVYSHLQTKQVVYSLRRDIKNNHALKQLPYNGKKTVPAALRKDLWAPLAMIEFFPPTAAANFVGLNAFRKLREYRKLHETQWPEELALDDKGKPLSRKLRGRKLRDQKANSVADMAAALKSVTVAPVEDGATAEVQMEKDAKNKSPGGLVKRSEQKIWGGYVKGVTATVRWTDIYDAEYAAEWPETVLHDHWETTRNNRKPWIVGESTETLAEDEVSPELEEQLGKVAL